MLFFNLEAFSLMKEDGHHLPLLKLFIAWLATNIPCIVHTIILK
jgi:hypothetical protein